MERRKNIFIETKFTIQKLQLNSNQIKSVHPSSPSSPKMTVSRLKSPHPKGKGINIKQLQENCVIHQVIKNVPIVVSQTNKNKSCLVNKNSTEFIVKKKKNSKTVKFDLRQNNHLMIQQSQRKNTLKFRSQSKQDFRLTPSKKPIFPQKQDKNLFSQQRKIINRQNIPQSSLNSETKPLSKVQQLIRHHENIIKNCLIPRRDL